MTNPLAAYDLSGRVAVVTGAASGIGAKTAEFLAAAGARVVCGDLNQDGIDATVGTVTGAGGTAVGQTADVTSRADVEALVQRALDEFGQLDIMCNIAGTMFPGMLAEVSDEQIDAAIDLNLKGVLYGCQAAVAAMTPRKTGSIVNVSSGAIDRPVPNLGLYAFTKAAVAMATMTLATEVGPLGIRVNAIAPGATITPFTTWRLRGPDGTIDQANMDAFVESMKAMSPLHAVGAAEDQAHLILYLCSDAAAFATGNIFRVNGGQTMVW
jgi:3-oxoacyl-[acyl-carrier protein] reductase